ncbi:hypothetical protein HAX54_039143, partial [Datura stramonium]|nr:hypothetical protein [Datura stramonium]
MTTFGDSLIGSGGTPDQFVVGFRPLLGSRGASVVRGSIPVTCCLNAGRLLGCSVFCCASASQQRFADSSWDFS